MNFSSKSVAHQWRARATTGFPDQTGQRPAPPAADAVVAKANTAGAKIATADLYSFVIANCGGVAGYATCPGFQLPMNVHYTPKGWAALAAEMHRNLLLVMYE